MIWRDRGRGPNKSEQTTFCEDDAWGYGQIFPLVLLILPLVSFLEVVYGKCPLLSINSPTTYDRDFMLIL